MPQLDLACGNIWGDQGLEIVVASDANSMVFRVDEHFDLEHIQDVSFGGWVGDLQIQDINSDGNDDLVATLTNDHQIKVLLASSEEESFLDPISYTVPSRPWKLTLADLDADQVFEAICTHTKLKWINFSRDSNWLRTR